MDFDEIVERYKTALPKGEFYHFPITAMDHTGVCSWSSVFLPGPLGGGDGYGLTDTEAEVGTLGELHERLQSLWVVPTLEHEEGTFVDLVAAYGEANVIDPVMLGLPAGSGYSPQTSRLWVKVKRYPAGEAYAPLEAVASGPAELPPGYRPLFLPVSNGLGAGLDESRALCHGVLELLQRDGNSVTYRALDQGRAVDLSGDLPDEVTPIFERLTAAGLTVNVKLAATDFGLVNLYVNGYGADDDHPQIKLAAGGEACDLDRTAALRKALLEFAFSRARLAFSHGPLREAAKVAPEGYFDAHRAHFHLENEEPRALRAMLSWLELAPAELRTKLTRIYETQEIVPWADLPVNPLVVAATPAARLDAARPHRLYALFYLAMATGLRRGELMGLRWEDIKGNILYVRQTLTKAKGELQVSTPKTSKGTRLVSLSPDVLEILLLHRQRQDAERLPTWPVSGLVFVSETGTPLNPDNLTRLRKQLVVKAQDDWKDVAAKAGDVVTLQKLEGGQLMPHMRLHDLRHLHASIAIKSGVDPKVLADRLGHARASFTLDVYTHLFDEQRVNAAVSLLDFLPRSNPATIN